MSSLLIYLNCWLIVLIINPWIYIHINESTFTWVLFCAFLESHPMFSIQDFRMRRKAVYKSFLLLLLLEILNGSSWDLSLLCHLVCLILMAPPRMSCLLLLSAGFPWAIYLCCPCTFLILNMDSVFHGERFCNCKGQTCVGTAVYMDEWSNQLIKNEETTCISPWIIVAIFLWNVYLHLCYPGPSVATPTGSIKISVLHTVLQWYIFLSFSKLTKNTYWTFACEEVNMFKRI